MVPGLLLPALVGFALVTIAAYVGTLGALDVYFAPDSDSVFLPEDAEPPRPR